MAIATYLDFEKPVADLEKRIAELEATGGETVEEEVGKLREKAEKQLEQIYTHLNAWQKTQVARHPERPHFRHYIDGMVEDFTPLAGDRYYAEDQALIVRMWNEGATLPRIGEAVDMQPAAVAAMIDRLRGLGVAVPYRRRPRSALGGDLGGTGQGRQYRPDRRDPALPYPRAGRRAAEHHEAEQWRWRRGRQWRGIVRRGTHAEFGIAARS